VSCSRTHRLGIEPTTPCLKDRPTNHWPPVAPIISTITTIIMMIPILYDPLIAQMFFSCDTCVWRLSSRFYSEGSHRKCSAALSRVSVCRSQAPPEAELNAARRTGRTVCGSAGHRRDVQQTPAETGAPAGGQRPAARRRVVPAAQRLAGRSPRQRRRTRYYRGAAEHSNFFQRYQLLKLRGVDV